MYTVPNRKNKEEKDENMCMLQCFASQGRSFSAYNPTNDSYSLLFYIPKIICTEKPVWEGFHINSATYISLTIGYGVYVAINSVVHMVTNN